MKQTSINNALNLRGHSDAEAKGLRFCTKCKGEKSDDLFDFPKGSNAAKAWCTSCRANKRCPKCDRTLPRDSHFPRIAGSRHRVRAYCIDCNKEYQRAWKLGANYQLSTKEYSELLASQKGKCLICKSSRKLVVDHDHISGKVRGILCDHCNRGLGYFRDNPAFLTDAAKYLGGAL